MLEDEPVARRSPPLPTSTTCQQLPTKEAASDPHFTINNRSKFRRSIALHNRRGCVRVYAKRRCPRLGLGRVASACQRMGLA